MVAQIHCNHTCLIEYFQHVNNDAVVFSFFEHENAHSYWFLWDAALPQGPVALARERFNICNGITLVRRTKNYYDMIAVALPRVVANPASFYLNKVRAIEQFVHSFELTNKDLISLINKKVIALPEAYRDVNYEKICLSKGKLDVMGKFGNTHITTQELSCLRHFLQGATYKEVAQALSISSRTAETYMQRIKDRTGWTMRQDLASMLWL